MWRLTRHTRQWYADPCNMRSSSTLASRINHSCESLCSLPLIACIVFRVWLAGVVSYNQAPKYGTRRAYSGGTPGGRHGACHTVDPVGGGLYMYSGQSPAGDTNRYDVWKFNTASNAFMWMAGANVSIHTSPGYPVVGPPAVVPGSSMSSGPGSKSNSMC
jgi:hypothetical protein